MWCDAENLDLFGSLEAVPGAPRNHHEFTRPQRGRVLRLTVEEEDGGGAVDDHDDLVADGVAFPFAGPGPVADEDCAISVGRQPLERFRRVFALAGRRAVRLERQLRDRLVDRNRDRLTLCHVSRLFAIAQPKDAALGDVLLFEFGGSRYDSRNAVANASTSSMPGRSMVVTVVEIRDV